MTRRRWLLLVCIVALAGGAVLMLMQPLAASSVQASAPAAAGADETHRPGRIEPIVTPPAMPTAARPVMPTAVDEPTAHYIMLPHEGIGRVVMTATAGDVMIAFALLLVVALQAAGLILGASDD
jgi:hypothetical protein